MPGASCQVHFGMTRCDLLLTPNVEGDGFDETGKDGDVDGCVCNWRAARPDNLKSMFSKFDETSIFDAVCQHGFILTCVDMV